MSSRESKPESCKAALTVNGHKTGTGAVWFGCDNPHSQHEVHFNKVLKARWVSVLAVLAALLAAATLSSGAAKADPAVDNYVITNAPAVCSVLDAYPSVAGIEGIGMELFSEGFTGEQAGEIVARSVVGWCPEYGPVLQQFIAKWTRAGQVRA